MLSFIEMYYAAKEKAKQEKEILSLKERQQRLRDRLYKRYEVEYKDGFGGYILPFPFQNNEHLIFSIPEFALEVLEKISDTDILTATEAVVVGIKYCTGVVTPDLIKCPKCSAVLPKGRIYFREINTMRVTKETRELLKTISTTQISVAGEVKNLNPIEEKVSTEIITSLVDVVKTCPDCGMKIVPKSANYCWNCGEKLENKYTPNEDSIVVSLPLDEIVESALNKIALEEMKDITEFDYEWQSYIEEFCNTLINNEMATAQLCKKLGALMAKLEEYDNAIFYYEKAMELDSDLDLYPQIERLEKKRDKSFGI